MKHQKITQVEMWDLLMFNAFYQKVVIRLLRADPL